MGRLSPALGSTAFRTGVGSLSQPRFCEDQHHKGNRLIEHSLDAYELRLERRRLYDRRDRKYRRVVPVICAPCAARWLEVPVEDLQGVLDV